MGARRAMRRRWSNTAWRQSLPPRRPRNTPRRVPTDDHVPGELRGEPGPRMRARRPLWAVRADAGAEGPRLLRPLPNQRLFVPRLCSSDSGYELGLIAAVRGRDGDLELARAVPQRSVFAKFAQSINLVELGRVRVPEDAPPDAAERLPAKTIATGARLPLRAAHCTSHRGRTGSGPAKYPPRRPRHVCATAEYARLRAARSGGQAAEAALAVRLIARRDVRAICCRGLLSPRWSEPVNARDAFRAVRRR